MLHVAIVGAGELGGAIAHSLARRDCTASIRLVDDMAQIAAGKALDIMQAAPILRFSTTVSGSSDLYTIAGSSLVVVADRADRRNDAEWQDDEGLSLLSRVVSLARASLVLCAGAAQRDLIERGVREGLVPRTRLFGSAPEAFAGAVRACVALEADRSPQDVALAVLGLPPHQLIIPWDQASVGGVALTQVVDDPAMRRLQGRLAPLWPPGPHALASAAVKAIEAVSGVTRQRLSCFVAADDSTGRRARTVALPVRLGGSGVVAADVPALNSHDRVALDNAMLL